MKKLLLYSLTLVGMLVSSTQSAVAQLENPDFKEMSSSTGNYYFYTKLTNLQNANSANWAADGKKSGTFKGYTSSKNGVLDPEKNTTDYNLKNNSVQISSSGNGVVYLYVSGITAFKVYAFNTGSSEARTLNVTVAEKGNSFSTDPTKTSTVNGGSNAQCEVTGLTSTTSYQIKIDASGTMALYCVQFTCKVADVVEAPGIDSDGLGNVTITHAAGTTVKYTTDGTEPTATLGTDYNDATGIVLTEDATVKAVAIRTEDSQLSEVTTLNVSVLKTIVGMQICNFNEGKVSNTDYFLGTISSASIDYTVDGENYTKAWKVQSADNLIFKTQNNALLKLVLAKRTDKSTYNYKILVMRY